MKILLVGASGQLGTSIQSLIKSSNLDHSFSTLITSKNQGDFLKAIDSSDVVIDVSQPIATLSFLNELLKNGKKIPYVIGCTGFARLPSELEEVSKYSALAPVLISENFSVAVTLLSELLTQIAPSLNSLGYSVKITETHHTKKRDAPSGTAKRFSNILEKVGLKPETESVREGNVVGTHVLRFESDFDEITFTHTAKNRELFAHGALSAANWLLNKSKKNESGLYSMMDINQVD